MRSSTIALSFLALVISAGVALARGGTTTTELWPPCGAKPQDVADSSPVVIPVETRYGGLL